MGKHGVRTSQARSMSEAFQIFFPEHLEESQLYLPAFRLKLIEDKDFLGRNEISTIKRSFERLHGEEATKSGFWTQERFILFLRIDRQCSMAGLGP
jgi:hypothetical protein